jgi:PAS domain S-box-containing protein
LQDIIEWLAYPAGLSPHGFCLAWNPWILWAYVAGNLGVGAAYFAIPFSLTKFLRKRHDLGPFRAAFRLFAAFILLCGTTHFASALTVFVPAYSLEASLMLMTAAVSLFTAWKLHPLVPLALALKSPSTLEASNAELAALTKALRSDRERAYAGFRGSPIPLHTMATDGTILDVSDRWLRLLGYTREEAEKMVIGRPWSERHETPDPHSLRHDLEDLRIGNDVQDRPRTLARRDGTTVSVEVSKRLERGEEGHEYIVCVVVDVSARREAEKALRQAEQRLAQASKMEAIGQITGGVAHDFNNLLQAIGGNLRLIKGRLDREEIDLEKLTRQAGNAITAVEHAARLTSQLLAFARRQPLNPTHFDPSQALDGVRALIETTAGPKVELRWNVEHESSTCFADPTQLSNAVLNLVANSKDAVSDNPSPVIGITIRRVWLTEVANDAPAPGEYLRIAVCDNGVGMGPDVRSRAFEPFFTTKEVGKGTGLGLASVHGFARQSGGTVIIDSELGKGSEVAILLPRHAAALGHSQEASGSSPSMPCGEGETVLVVEDVQAVREVLAEQLEELGYRVLQVETADEAVDVLMVKHASIDAVLTDMMMPGRLDGLELCGLIRAKWRDIPVALMTGNLDAQRNVRLPRGTMFLAKPYPMVDLARMIQDMLSKKPARA